MTAVTEDRREVASTRIRCAGVLPSHCSLECRCGRLTRTRRRLSRPPRSRKYRGRGPSAASPLSSSSEGVEEAELHACTVLKPLPHSAKGEREWRFYQQLEHAR